MKTVRDVLKNKTPSSSATYKIESTRSDGRMPDKKTKPATETDKKIHFGHIVDSGQYNLRHEFDHGEELAFDYQRLSKEHKDKEAHQLQKQTMKILGPVYKKMNIRLVLT